jgi:uncharacterized protein YdhG (YjbR/CyaY superfamily)
MAKFSNVDDYIAAQASEAQPRLREMRAVIRAALPDASELISYDVPTYRFRGGFVSFGAAKKHCALYGTPLDTYPQEVSAYSTSKGTIRFPLDTPIPEDLVRKLVQTKAARSSEATSERK